MVKFHCERCNKTICENAEKPKNKVIKTNCKQCVDKVYIKLKNLAKVMINEKGGFKNVY